MTDTPWIRRSMREKREHQIAKRHARPYTCPLCETQVMPEQHQAHRERCTGLREPEPLDKWATEAELPRLGVQVEDARRAVSLGVLRVRGEGSAREYLLRDVARYVDAQRIVPATKPPAAPAQAVRAVRELTTLEARLLEALSEVGQANIRTLRLTCRRNGTDVKKALANLVRGGSVRRVRRKRGAVYCVSEACTDGVSLHQRNANGKGQNASGSASRERAQEDVP